MWYGASSSTHTVARVAKASSGQPGDGDSQLAAWIVTYTARSMYGFNSDGGYSVMKMRTGRFDYNDNEVRFSTEQDTLGTGGGSQNPTIVFSCNSGGHKHWRVRHIIFGNSIQLLVYSGLLRIIISL